MLKNYDIAVVFGGISGESEVSVITGTMVCNVLKKGGKSVLPVYVDKTGSAFAGDSLADVTAYKCGTPKSMPCAMVQGGFVLFAKSGKVKYRLAVGCIINCCHGGVYEGGAVAGAAAFNKIPFASASLFESAAFMDKYYTKLVLSILGVKVAKYEYLRHSMGAIDKLEGLNYPIIVKPATLGSSIGITKVENEEELQSALKLAFELDDGVILEEYFKGRREINCAVYFADDKVVVSPCEEVSSSGEILSYDDKYSGGGVRKFPVEGEAEEVVRTTAERVYKALNMRGIVRFDFIESGGEVYLSEINTVPGSLSQYLLSDSYKGFYGVLCKVVEQAKRDYVLAQKKRVISTGILNNITPNACKIK